MPDWVYYDKSNRGLIPALNLINSVSSELNLTKNVVEFSSRLYQILLNKKLTVGRKRESLVGACIYICCQGVNYPIKLKELCKSLDITNKELVRQKKHIKQHVETNEQGISIESYISRYGYELRLNNEEITQAEQIVKMISQKLINHKTDIKAAVSLYLATRNKNSIRDIARTTGLSRSGIYEAYKKVKHLIPATDLLTSKQSIHIINRKEK